MVNQILYVNSWIFKIMACLFILFILYIIFSLFVIFIIFLFKEFIFMIKNKCTVVSIQDSSWCGYNMIKSSSVKVK